jgi:predicted amidohydrolase YtcJ
MPQFNANQSRLLYNGTIITCDDQSTTASAVWIEGGRI